MRTISTNPGTLPPVLRRRIAATAKAAKLSLSEVVRQAIALGLPALHEKFEIKARRLVNVPPLPANVWRRIYSDASLDEGYNIGSFMSAQAWPKE